VVAVQEILSYNTVVELGKYMKCVELFAGAGGLALGASNLRFHHEAVVELNPHACNTIRANQRRGFAPVLDWPLMEIDVHKVDFSKWNGRVDIVTGGPPCQPFSIGGKHRGSTDERNLFPEAVRAVREICPKAFVFENVKGLVRDSFAKYFSYIILQLTFPAVPRRKGEEWITHLGRLERLHTEGRETDLHYKVAFRLLNAADYGVPQRRERVFIVGIRSDLEKAWSFPDPTHSRDALLTSQQETGEYWERHSVARRWRLIPSRNLDGDTRYAMRLSNDCDRLPWRTVRDAISDLGEPSEDGKNALFQNHILQAGARAYPGHTGSPLDAPAKTLKAGDHGVPGGENMLLYPDGRVRYFTVRESCRLQTFPDGYVFDGSWSENMRQLGNAVPVTLGEKVLRSVQSALANHATRNVAS
jgi:DNA (cytosine-5)-methyltransferase 1